MIAARDPPTEIAGNGSTITGGTSTPLEPIA
jgi:hypothetical protein